MSTFLSLTPEKYSWNNEMFLIWFDWHVSELSIIFIRHFSKLIQEQVEYIAEMSSKLRKHLEREIRTIMSLN